MSFTSKAVAYLPSRVKTAILKLYQKWSSRIIIDKEMLRNLVDFYNQELNYTEAKLTYKEAICLCKLAARINADFWRILNPKTEEEIKKFYQNIIYYPFELAYWHMNRYQRKFRKEIVRLSFGDVLDYGGGIGDLCLKLAKKGLNVVYGDVRGINWKFAEWLFKKYGYKIKMIDLGEGKIPDDMMFDTIICIDTIEHVPNPERALEDIAIHLKNGGRLIITNLKCSGQTEMYPMHLKIDFDAEKLLNSFGIFKSVDKSWLWIKKNK